LELRLHGVHSAMALTRHAHQAVISVLQLRHMPKLGLPSSPRRWPCRRSKPRLWHEDSDATAIPRLTLSRIKFNSAIHGAITLACLARIVHNRSDPSLPTKEVHSYMRAIRMLGSLFVSMRSVGQLEASESTGPKCFCRDPALPDPLVNNSLHVSRWMIVHTRTWKQFMC
jgi:hypothetical protein